MNLSGFGSVLASTYTDLLQIYRHKVVTNEDGTTGLEMPAEPIYNNVRCRISFPSKDYPESSAEDSNPIRLAVKIFCSPDQDIQKGDRLIVARVDHKNVTMMTYEGIANLPLVYATHKEVEIIKVGDA